ncbi:MAG: hypothetical protein PHP45_10220 [Elusimicrobiales bacterium]|nr:hypothetical protein [Elusimicrobiales bacterium]
MLKRVSVYLAAMLSCGAAFAQCGSPAGVAGQMKWLTPAMKYCDGANWVSMSSGTPGGLNGYVQFNNSGDFGGDSGLFWDNSAKRLGIGTTAPGAVLEVVQDGAHSVEINYWGDIRYRYSGDPADAYRYWLLANTADAGMSIGNAVGILFKGGDSTYRSVIATPLDDLAFYTGGTTNANSIERLRIAQGGNVGIGTTVPSQKLDVFGKINFNTSGQNATINNYYGANSVGSNIFIGDGGQSSVGESGATYKGSENVFVGISAGQSNNTGYYNAFVGRAAGTSNTTGLSNVAVGNRAGYSNTTGAQNVFVGQAAGRFWADGSTALETPTNSVYIGYAARGYNNSDSNSIVIGANAIGIGANSVVLGNSSIATTVLRGNVGIGTTSPTSLLTLSSAAGGLTVSATGAPYVELYRPGQSHWKLQHLNNGFGIQNNWAGTGYVTAMGFDDGLAINPEILHLAYASGGNRVGIGTTAPSTTLDVNGVVTVEAGPATYVVCYTSAHALGHCTSAVGAGGTCTCAAN